jgi:hypothetical protein
MQMERMKIVDTTGMADSLHAYGDRESSHESASYRRPEDRPNRYGEKPPRDHQG